MRAAGLVRTGRSVSLSRDFPKTPGRGNPQPAQHFVRMYDDAVVDYYGISYHRQVQTLVVCDGHVTTHVDALCHVWDSGGMTKSVRDLSWWWNGRDPKAEITSEGARFGGIENWRDGITTRGVLLDVPRFRGEPHVTLETPVHGWELAAICEAQGVSVEPGDALVVYSGRESWQAANPAWSGYSYHPGHLRPPSPGLHASCMPFVRGHDVSALCWDLMDAVPNEYGLRWSMHGALYAYGVALVDNALLQPLAAACAEEGRWEFMFTLAPLPVVGGTGSPVNPLALF